MLGTLIKGLGYDHVFWGTSSVFIGSPQWQIEAFRRIEIPEDLQKKFGFSPLGAANSTIKNAIFGQNAVRHYGMNTAFGFLPVSPSRMFAGPTQYPPKDFKAYGIVAFDSLSSRDDKARYDLICDAYVSSLQHFTEVKAPLKEQMVTVWPIDTNREAININKIALDGVCARAVANYGLVAAQNAIAAAKLNKAVLNGRGPFLLAWAPGVQTGQPDALVLVSNLSNVVNIEDAKDVFALWKRDIQDNPDLWGKGWDLAKLKLEVRLWADRYGEDILKYFKRS